MSGYLEAIEELKKIDATFELGSKVIFHREYDRWVVPCNENEEQMVIKITQLTQIRSHGSLFTAERLLRALKKRLRYECSTAMRLNVLIEIALTYIELYDIKNALETTNEALSLARESSIRLSEADALIILSTLSRFRQQYDKALFFIEQAIKIARELPCLITLNEAYLEQGKIYLDARQYSQALMSFKSSAVYSAASMRHRDAIVSLLSLVRVYRIVGDYEKAQSEFDQSLRYYKEFKIEVPIIEFYEEMGLLLLDKHCYSEALNWYIHVENQIRFKWYEYYEKPSGILRSIRLFPFLLFGYASAYNGLGEYKKALFYLRKALRCVRLKYINNLDFISKVLNQCLFSFQKLHKDDTVVVITDLLSKMNYYRNNGLEKEFYTRLHLIFKRIPSTYTRGDLFVDITKREIYFGEDRDNPILLSKEQACVFKKLLDNIGYCVSFTQLVNSFDHGNYGDKYDPSVADRIKHMIVPIRAKMKFNTEEPIESVRGRGYKLIN